MANDYLAFDWRWLGALNAGIDGYRTRPADTDLRRFAAGDRPVTQDSSGDGRVVTLRLTEANGMEREASFDKSSNCRLMSASSRNAAVGSEGKTQVSYHDPSDPSRPFPKRIAYTETENGRVVNSDVIDIGGVVLGPPDERVFELAGLGLRVGQAIAYPDIPTSADYPVWNGQYADTVNNLGKVATEAHLREKQLKPPPTQRAPAVGARRVRWLSLVLGVVLLAIGVSLALRTRRRVHPPTERSAPHEGVPPGSLQ